MTATLTTNPVSREHLRAFHLTGRGLDDLQPLHPPRPILPDAMLSEIPQLEKVFPVALPAAAAGFLVPFHADSAPLIHGAFLATGRAPARAAFALRLRQAIAQLRELLAVDDAKLGPASLTGATAALGADAGRFLSVSRLMAVFGRQSQPRSSMDPVRRRRIETALATLEGALGEQTNSPLFRLFLNSPGWPNSVPPHLAAAGGVAIPCADPCGEALACCERQFEAALPVLRSIRIAKLEAAFAYDVSIHDEALSRFDWQSAEPDEIAALPAVLALETPSKIAEASLVSFSRVLRSGMPVQVLIPFTGPAPGAPDIGALALAHSGAFVLQSSMARWDHLSIGLTEMARSLHPAVAIIAVPSGDDEHLAWQQAFLLSNSPVVPLFRCNPDPEGGWADRFELTPPAAAFAELTLPEAMAPNLGTQFFRVVPPEAWDEDQLEIHEYLRRYRSAPPQVVPFLNAAGPGGELLRLALTRELAHLCFDQRKANEMLSALAAKSPTHLDSDPRPDTRRDASVPATGIAEAAAREAYLRVAALLQNPESLAVK